MLKRMIALCLVIAMLFCFAGCDTQPATSDTQPTQDSPIEHKLDSTMYFTQIAPADGEIITSFEADVKLVITENPDGSCSFDCTMPLSDDSFYDFAHPDNTFEVQHTDQNLPYYCAKARIYMPATNGFTFYDFAVDTEKGYLIFKLSLAGNLEHYYVVASSDPNAEPLEIAEYFSAFFQLYDYSSLFAS